jgi:hypothetical protein
MSHHVRAHVRIATSLFAGLGFQLGLWAVLVPELVTSRGLSPGGLGVALGVLAATSILSLSAAGLVADRIGRRPLACAGSAGIGHALIALAAVEARGALLPTVAFYDLANGRPDRALGRRPLESDARRSRRLPRHDGRLRRVRARPTADRRAGRRDVAADRDGPGGRLDGAPGGHREAPLGLAGMPTWADVVAAGRKLPEVEEGTWFRTPCLRVRKKSFCRMKEDGETLVVRVVDLEDKEALLRSDPEIFFTTPHYDGYAYVLVRLERADPAQLAELIEDAWRLSAPKRVLAAYDAER